MSVIVFSFQYVGLPVFGQLCHMCPVSSMCFVYFEFCLSVLMAWICSLYWTLKVHPVCLVYLSGHSLHFNSYTPLQLYVPIVFLFILDVFYCVSSFECCLYVILSFNEEACN
jgi:uncharacterized membrane protein YcgQ (UPF0703/DUF1980 family)